MDCIVTHVVVRRDAEGSEHGREGKQALTWRQDSAYIALEAHRPIKPRQNHPLGGQLPRTIE